jgi:hypothetical protein
LKRILIIYPTRSPFVREDIDILQRHFQVTEYHHHLDKNPFVFFYQYVRQLVFLLFNARRFDYLYIWFADYHSFLPVLLGKWFRRTTLMVLGGFDTMSIPQIGYGVFARQNLRAWLAAYAIRHANHLLGVDETMFEGVNDYVDVSGLQVGVRNFVTGIEGACHVIPTGYDAGYWRRGDQRKEMSVLTIGACSDLKVLKRKGLDMFTKVASAMPDIPFTIVGPSVEMQRILMTDAPPNLTVLGYLPQDELRRLASRSKVFCQLSMAEGLPNTLCESMLCECIPVGSSANGIPKAINDERLIVRRHMDVADAAAKIRYALSLPDADGRHFRERIIELFPASRREQDLVSVINTGHV